MMIALSQTGDSPRRRSSENGENGGNMDTLRNQIIERKVVELILRPRQQFKEVAVRVPNSARYRGRRPCGTREAARMMSEIPEAKPGESI